VRGAPLDFHGPSGGSHGLPWSSLVSRSRVHANPFPPPQGSDTIPIAGRPPRSKAGQGYSVQPVLPGGPVPTVTALPCWRPAG
jgi:hypothetical protein